MRELLVVHGAWVGLGLVAATALFGALLQLAWVRLRHLGRWRARVGALARRAPIVEGAEGRFDGVLRVESALAPAFDGSPCAVTTAAAAPERARDLHAVSRRADRLVLEVGAHRLVVEGPIAIVTPDAKSALGDEIVSRIVEAGEAEEHTYRTLRTELRRLDDGERVRLVGALRREADAGAGYRDAADALALVGVGGPVLGGSAPRSRWPWRGAALAAFAAWGAVSLAGAWRVEGMELVSVLHRTDALERLPPEDQLLRLDPNDHAGRARTLRAMGRPEAALREASRGTDAAALHERVALSAAEGRRSDFVDAWLLLVASLDAECAKGGRCLDHAALAAETLTPARWAGPRPTRAPLEALYSEAVAWGDDPETTLLLGARLWDLAPKSALLARLRVTWLFELAGLLTATGAPEGAREAQARIEAALDDPRLERPTRHRVQRDLHHLNALLAIREGSVRSLPQSERHHEGGWCPMRDAVRLAVVPREANQRSAFPSFGGRFAADLSAVREGGAITDDMRDRMSDGDAVPIEQAAHYARLLGAEARAELRETLAPTECPASMTVATLAREVSRSRALHALDAFEASDAALACAREHASLVDGPWSSGGDPRARDTIDRVAALIPLLRFLQRGRRPRRHARPRRRTAIRYAAMVHAPIPAHGEP
ncbi:MAG: hypothetical protein R3B82_05800 [Sandaracinaceae bacterium]